MDEYKWTLIKSPRNDSILGSSSTSVENCIKPKNYEDTLQANRLFNIPKGLTKRAAKLMHILSGFPEISLIKNILRVNNRNIMRVESFLKSVYSAKRSSGKKINIILNILSNKGDLAKAQFDKSNMIVWKKINRSKKHI